MLIQQKIGTDDMGHYHYSDKFDKIHTYSKKCLKDNQNLRNINILIQAKSCCRLILRYEIRLFTKCRLSNLNDASNMERCMQLPFSFYVRLWGEDNGSKLHFFFLCHSPPFTITPLFLNKLLKKNTPLSALTLVGGWKRFKFKV